MGIQSGELGRAWCGGYSPNSKQATRRERDGSGREIVDPRSLETGEQRILRQTGIKPGGRSLGMKLESGCIRPWTRTAGIPCIVRASTPSWSLSAALTTHRLVLDG